MPFRLVLRNLTGHPIRALLTFGSVFLAVFLLCILTATTTALTAGVEKASTHRLVVQSAVSLYVNLPLSYREKIQRVPGVEWMCLWQWFGGQFRDEQGFFAQFGCDPETLQKTYPEMEMVDGSYQSFVDNRVGCVIGTDLVAEYGWRVGDRIPILSNIFPLAGGRAWEFTVEGIYRSTQTATFDQKTLFFHFDLLREALEAGDARGPEGAGVYVLKVADDADPTQVMADVDALFENGPQRVQTTTESEFQRQFVSMLGNVPGLLSMIGGAVLFAIFFAVLNTMMMAARERTHDIGILKALGFTDRTVLLMLVAEGLVLCGAAGALGTAAAFGMEQGLARLLMNARIPGFEITGRAAFVGVGLALGLGLVSGLLPGYRASRLEPVRALRMEA